MENTSLEYELQLYKTVNLSLMTAKNRQTKNVGKKNTLILLVRKLKLLKIIAYTRTGTNWITTMLSFLLDL